MRDLCRRDFLKLFGAAGAGAALTGCSEPTRYLIPYINPPEDVVPGKGVYYATTCRECPAGCGMVAKNREGRIVKVEGNPAHPVSEGKLCMRGQASLHGLYNPDRFQGPMLRKPDGGFDPITWELGEAILSSKLTEAVRKVDSGRIVVMTDLITGSLRDLTGFWLNEMGQQNGHVMYETWSYEPLRKANQVVFGRDGIPTYRFDELDFLISFNAGLLETWISNLEFARQYGSFHPLRAERKNTFVFVGPRLSMTANNADLWIPTRPGTEYAVGLGIIRTILDNDLAREMPAERRTKLASMVNDWPVDKAATTAGCDPGLIEAVAKRFAGATRPLAIAEGLSQCLPNSTETAVAANLLCTIKHASLSAIDFNRESSYTLCARADQVKTLADRMRSGEVDVFIFRGVNPVFSLPKSWDFAGAMKAVPFVAGFSSAIDETGALAHMVLPTNYSFESWGDHSPRPGVSGFMQPVMGPVFNTKHMGDILISTGKKVKGEDSFPFKDFYEALQGYWTRISAEAGSESFDTFWQNMIMQGGYWPQQPPAAPALSLPVPAFSFAEPERKPGAGPPLVIYPTIQFYDGRMANHLWLQEIPDPMTQATWGGWLEIHPRTAGKLNLKKGDLLEVKTGFGTIRIPALPIYTVPEGVVAIPVGQGHSSFGRFATGLPANPFELLAPDIDPFCGSIRRQELNPEIEKTGETFDIANTDGSFFQEGRGMAVTMALEERNRMAAAGEKPNIYYPLPEGYQESKDFYPAHNHKDYRWAMVVDLDRCIGCGACVAGCYSENNVAVVKREQILKGREMSWIRVQRYFDDNGKAAKWLVMLCQHCDNAPCEYVCPIFAPQHSVEGLNNQIYNRCFGTRFCSQNDPYKVRRFNWFTFTRPEPLKWQLNPDVTVRQKGVMEKCSFCVHRIIEAKLDAKAKGREKVRDGDFTTACAQTCPTGALIFGSLLDPDSRVSKLINDVRAYQVLAHLNTKPAVIYLKKVTQEITV
ncbi:MAG: molybdopterin dinucleotide binding domain-containing protein [Syntrophobacteraceae bacterium]|jgi:molybdopterin-containing oxidoreductase family iron-sulfur binding subunit